MSAIKPRTATVVIYQGDDLTTLREYDEAVVKAERKFDLMKRQAKAASGTALLTDEQPDPVAAEQDLEDARELRDAFAAEAEGRGVRVVLHQVGRREWRRLRTAHPPRDGNSEDEALDCNVDEFPDAVIPKSVCRDSGCPICQESGKPSTIEGDLEEFLDSISHHDYYNRVFGAVLGLNVGGGGADPTLRLGSEPTAHSDATSS